MLNCRISEKNQWSAGWKEQRGASMVEFAIVLPLLLLLVFGMIEFSILLYDKAVITNASREGARFASMYYVDPADHDVKPRPTSAIYAIIDGYVSGHLISLGAPRSQTRTATRSIVSGVYAWTVTVNYQYVFLIIPNFVTSITGPINLSAVTVMRDENQSPP
jgi:Flp pilus assembly protein TadG